MIPGSVRVRLKKRLGAETLEMDIQHSAFSIDTQALRFSGACYEIIPRLTA
jgi:hypothetical protein